MDYTTVESETTIGGYIKQAEQKLSKDRGEIVILLQMGVKGGKRLGKRIEG